MKPFFKLIRMSHWIKNIFIFSPLFFSKQLMNNQVLILYGFYGFIAFSLIASAIYCFNDIVDLEFDKKHPQKKNRPIANGSISKKNAIYGMLLLALASFIISYQLLGVKVLVLIISYFILNILYTLHLKNIMIIDILCISTGFLLRIAVGGLATNTSLSYWILWMVFLLSILLVSAKRRDEAIIFKNEKHSVRRNIVGYTSKVTSFLLYSTSFLIIATYLIYSIYSEFMKTTHYGYATTIWVVLGIIRYLILTKKRKMYANPIKIVLNDYILQTIIILWLLNCYIVLYR